MAKKDDESVSKLDTNLISEVAKTETVILFHVNKPLNEHEYAELETRVRAEESKSGLKIVLAPFSVDPKIMEE